VIGPKTGQRRQFRKAGFATKREAASAVAELKTKLDKGTYIKPTTCTLGEYALEWLPRRERSDKGLKATTLSGYRRYIEADIEPSALGGMRLTDIRRYHVATFVAELTNAGRGAVTVRRILPLLGTIFASALKDELIAANPGLGCRQTSTQRRPCEGLGARRRPHVPDAVLPSSARRPL
jgi:hypothetical protein